MNIFSVYRAAHARPGIQRLFISGWGMAVRLDGSRRDWYVRGTVLRHGEGMMVIEVTRLEGGTVQTEKEAEQQGLELAKAWVDQRTR